MSRNDAIPPLARHPSSRTNNAVGGGGENGEDVADRHPRPVFVEECVHDHSRPFPPPRLPTGPPPPPPAPQSNVTTTTTSVASVPGTPTSRIAPLTMPLTPLSSSFRSRPTLRHPQNVETSTDANSRSLLTLPADTTAATTTTTTTTTTTSPRSPLGEVSLATPRPDGERTINEYVETPFKHPCCNQERRLDADNKAIGDCPKIERRHHHNHHHLSHHHHHLRGHEGTADTALVPTHRTRGRARNHQGLRGFNGGANTGVSAITAPATTTTTATGTAVTKQPVSFTKEPANALGGRTPYDPAGLSIICDFCDKCRCESCREPPPLPSKWLCDNTCLCSAETALDYASCLCCVKGLFYHCVDGGGGGGVASGVDGEVGASCSDEPCSCTGHRRLSRWACLGALTLIMPCLLCYWPFKGCITLCEVCYARYAAQGCRCNPNAAGSAGGRHHPIAGDIGDSRDPEKRLLDPITPEL